MKLEDEIKQSKFKNEHQKVAVNIIFTHNWLQYDFGAELKKANLTIQQFNVLRILRGRFPEPASVKLLKERLLDKMSDTSRIVEKLRLKGLIERRECPNDRRNVDITITKEGLNLLSTLDYLDDHFPKRLGAITNTEAKELNHLLDKLRG